MSDYTFWEDLWDYLEIRYSIRFSKVSAIPSYLCVIIEIKQVLEEGKLLKEIPIWFPGARLNYAENILSRDDDSIACTASSELGEVTHCSYRELRERVRVMVSALSLSGVSVGDRVAGKLISSVQWKMKRVHSSHRHKFSHGRRSSVGNHEYRCCLLEHCNRLRRISQHPRVLQPLSP